MTTMTFTAGRLAELGERTPGFCVLTASGKLTNWCYRRSPSGRRNRSYVQATYPDGRVANLDADLLVHVEA
jgi:hypothetical protein